MTSGFPSQSPPATYMHHHHHHMRRHRMPSGGEDIEDEELDPRIQIELEKLNRASEEINRLELELDDARAAFRTALSDSTQRLNGLAKKLGACVDKARPYYDARMKLKEAHLESQKAALRFERACSMHEAAKEMVQLAEEGYKRREQDLDPTWQEMLNHATMKVNDAERERIESEEFHQQTTLSFKHKEEEVQRLQKDLKRSITKSKPYFEMKAKFNQVMEERKRSVSRLEEDVTSTKALYSQALRSLEAISDDIHRQRLERRQKLELGVRGAGVGAESPSPPPWEKGSTIEGSASCQYPGDSDYGKVSHTSEKVSSAPLLSRPTGIVCHEAAFRKKTSVTETLIKDGKFKPDPLDVVVFKTAPANQRGGPSKSGPAYDSNDSESPTEMYAYSNRARSASYRTAIELSSKPSQVKPSLSKTERIDGIQVSARESKSMPPGFAERQKANDQFDRISDGLESPGYDMDLSQSSVRRAQEWVNKSPVPQQRSFVKSKSLIDATALSLDQQQNFNLSSSLTTEAFRGVAGKYTADVLHPAGQPIHQQGQYLESTPEAGCQPGSPSVHRKSPKLQGLILCVDPGGLVTAVHNSPSQTPPVPDEQGSKPVISTQQLGFFSDKMVQLPTTVVPKPPTSLIAQQINKMMNAANKGQQSIKNVPSTLSASYSISQPPISQPSPVWNSPPPSAPLTSGVSVRHHLTSPTPSSPSADRVSLSGRSDTLSASSSRGAFLKPPSDSSDTESIASTGPMLDDDQVELISMDFSEQSIVAEPVDDGAYFGDDRTPVPRGHWSRMSLPPRLSYLEGFLERARLYTSAAGQQGDGSSNPEDGTLSEGSSNSSPSNPENSQMLDIEYREEGARPEIGGQLADNGCPSKLEVRKTNSDGDVNHLRENTSLLHLGVSSSTDAQENPSVCDKSMAGPEGGAAAMPEEQTNQAVGVGEVAVAAMPEGQTNQMVGEVAVAQGNSNNLNVEGKDDSSPTSDWDKSEYFV